MRATIFLCTILIVSSYAPVQDRPFTALGLLVLTGLLLLLDLIDTSSKIETKKKDANAHQANTE